MPSIRFGRILLTVVVMTLVPAWAVAQPSFDKTFQPSTIAPGSVATLRFDIDNSFGPVASDLVFTDVLPASVSIASPTVVTSSCGGTLSTPDGGTTITLTDGSVAAGGSCSIAVDVTSSTVGVYTNTSGDLTSDAGNSGPATADLTVATDRPAFSKSFAPSSVPFGGRSTLTFTIDNSANPSAAGSLSFSDALPSGLTIADPPDASNECNGTLTANADGGSISLLGGLVLAGSTCTVTVDVVARALGTRVNSSSELLSSASRSSGKANALLEITGGSLLLTKSFLDDPVLPGDIVDLEFTVSNRERADAAADIAFTDDLGATLSGLVATGLPLADVCGPGSTLSGGSVITLSGGSLAAEASCSFTVSLQVPAGAIPGAYPNITSPVSATLRGDGVVGTAGNDTLFVDVGPQLTKTFLDDPVGAGGTTTLEFTITNASTTSAATAITFTDDLGGFLSGVALTAVPAAGFCGAGSTVFQQVGPVLGVNGANLAPGASCTFSVDLAIPASAAGGPYVNTTSVPTAMIDGATRTGSAASDTLTVLSAPRLTKEFTDDPVQPGGAATLQFTLEYDPFASADATAIAFTDDLDAVLSGLVAVGLPQNDVCGSGSQISGTGLLTFTGGTLAPGGSCTFPVTVQVPAGAVPGTYPNITSSVTATVSGEAVTSLGASDTLRVSGLGLTKEFVDDPAIPGGTVTLRFTLANTSTSSDATGIFFSDNLSATLSGLQASGALPASPCGAGSTLTGTTNLVFTGGNLVAGTSCSFDVTLQVPLGAATDSYLNTTSSVAATIGGSAAVLPAASDALFVSSDLLLLTKEFTDDPVSPGDTVTLELTVSNGSASETVTGITFTDDLDAVLSGLVATGLPASDVCGVGSQLSGTGLLTLTGGSLGPGASCTFSVLLQLPAAAPTGLFVNTTSAVSGSVGGLAVQGAPASDTLAVSAVSLTKGFGARTQPGGAVTLSFSVVNQSATTAVSGLSFTDDLDAVLSGLVAIGLPASDVCGPGSQLTGTALLTLTGGSLGPGASCSFDVTVQVPVTAAPGDYLNTTSTLFAGGLSVGAPTTATLGVDVAPAVTKTFQPGTVSQGVVTTLLFVIDNGLSPVSADGLSFTDDLPAGMVVAPTPNASTTCTGGTLDAVAGGTTVSYTGGSVAAGALCTVMVDVVANVTGTLVNTVEVSSSLGASAAASGTLVVGVPIPVGGPLGTAVLIGLLLLVGWRLLRP